MRQNPTIEKNKKKKKVYTICTKSDNFGAFFGKT
jgi:hypothetical protein